MKDQSTRRAGPREVFRTLGAIAAIAPGLIAGFATLLWTGDRRLSLNLATELWGRQGLRAAGVDLSIKGAVHLDLRPAVFTINHQSGVDPIIVCALLRRDFVGVAKMELRRNPLLGPAFAFADTVFLDREDHAQAVKSLDPAVDTLKRGLAIAIAPEGTRSRGAQLGRFKKGAFRVAMAAGVPIVPVVIHNSSNILPRGARIMIAGTVDVTVHPPIQTRDWTLEDLNRHVADVEAIYLENLGIAHRERVAG